MAKVGKGKREGKEKGEEKRRLKITFIIVLGIILLATFLRFYNLDSVPGLDYDSAAYAQRVQNILDGKEAAPQVGFQIYFGPVFFYWLAALSSVFGLSIGVMRAFLAISSVLTVAMIYLVGKRFFNERVGLIAALLAALLAALSVWQIAQTRIIWEINLLPLFATMVLYLLPKSLKRKELVPIVGLLIGIAFQIHNTGILLVPIAVMFYLLHDRKILASRFALLAVIAFLLAYSPVIQFNVTHQFTTLDYYKRLITGNAESKNIDIFLRERTMTALDIMKENLSGPWRFTNPVKEDLFLNTLMQMPVIFVIWIFSFLLLLDKALYGRNKDRIGIFLTISNLFLLIAIGALGNGVVTHYFTLIVPFAFVSVAYSIDFLIKSDAAKPIVILFIALLAIQSLNYLYRDYFQFYYSVGGTGYFETTRCCKEEAASYIQKIQNSQENTNNRTLLYFEDDLNLYNPVAFYLNDYSFTVLKSCGLDSFARNATRQMQIFVFDYNSTCDQNFRAFISSNNLQQLTKAEIIKSPSGETNVYSIYVV